MRGAALRGLGAAASAAALSGLLAGGCAQHPPAVDTPARTATLQRSAHGVAHISAPDVETLAYGVAWAHAEDNVCQTAQHLVTVRGERARFFGGTAQGQLGLRLLPNEQIDLFIAAHMDDARLEAAWAAASADASAMGRGYVAGYNRYLADHAGRLPVACHGAPWLRPMTVAEHRRMTELSNVQAGIGALADALLAARPPQLTAQNAGRDALSQPTPPFDTVALQADLRARGLLDSPLGSNAWAFGRDSTDNGRGVLLGNPHFPWTGVNRFWQLHLTVPGRFDAMGASLGHTALVQIGFNRDVAWSHTVSTGRRFTLHALRLVPGEPTRYLVDGRPEAMTPQPLSVPVLQADGSVASTTHTVWRTRWGPVIVLPRAGLGWSEDTAYALQDANTLNTRGVDTWLGFMQATGVDDMRAALRNLGVPWVNTIAADRAGNALYADVSVIPDVDAAQLARCAPSPAAAALLRSAGLVVLDGSRADCGWRRDPASAVPGLTPMERLPVAVRTDWVHNSNDSFFHTHPEQRFGTVSPLVGDARLNVLRTRAGLGEIRALLARGKVGPQAVQRALFENRNTAGHLVMTDLLAACAAAPPPTAEARDGCTALAGWDRTSNGAARGAHLFREFWRNARAIPGVWRLPFVAERPAEGPSGLAFADPAVAAPLWAALASAVTAVRAAGFALDAPLASVQRAGFPAEPIGLHGGEDFEGVLNNLGARAQPGIGPRGLRIDYGTSYVQTVGFDARGPVAQAILTYGQSTDPASPHATDQLRLYARKEWPLLPFHAEDVEAARVGAVARLVRP